MDVNEFFRDIEDEYECSDEDAWLDDHEEDRYPPWQEIEVIKAETARCSKGAMREVHRLRRVTARLSRTIRKIRELLQ